MARSAGYGRVCCPWVQHSVQRGVLYLHSSHLRQRLQDQDRQCSADRFILEYPISRKDGSTRDRIYRARCQQYHVQLLLRHGIHLLVEHSVDHHRTVGLQMGDKLAHGYYHIDRHHEAMRRHHQVQEWRNRRSFKIDSLFGSLVRP